MSYPRRQRHRGRGHSEDGPPRHANGAERPAPRHANGRGLRVPELCELTPFSLFCALYLGITEEDGYEPQGRERVARRFGISSEELDGFLRSCGLSEQDLRAAAFDVESARLDMAVAPPGISRMELARSLFAQLPAAASSEAPSSD